MSIDFSKLFHQSSKDHTNGGAVYMPRDPSEWPPEWTTVYYKTYPRFRKLALPDAKPRGTLAASIEKRRSRRDFSRVPIETKVLSAFLKYSCGIVSDDGRAVRAQPSGGGRFPLEVYPLVVKENAEIPAGLYHYNVQEHALDVLWQRPFSAADLAELFTYEWIRDASVIMVMTAVFYRNQMKYGERGYRYMLLEAGHIGQNMYLNAADSGLKCCALGGTRDEPLERLLDIDGITESVVYAVALG